ncbi:MAG: YHS domain protein [Rhodobacteraceae bacterium]|nr:MAG: YHS domain protein [Paracoccaceae bacterium]
MRLTRRTALGLIVASLATPVFAAQDPIFNSGGIALNGYDPVAYFIQSKPVKGRADMTSDYSGSTFQFASVRNKAKFDAAPAQYAPQYGGYCAYAVSKGSTAKTDPDAWTIVDGKLYLNYSRAVRAIWKTNIAGNIAKADANWPQVLEN